jgi:phage gpG-like protein
MADGLRVEIRDAGLVRALAGAVSALEHPQALMERIGAVLEANIEQRFRSKTDPDGNPWLPLAESTRERYKAVYKGTVPGSLLERTRHMRQSLAHEASDAFVDVGFGDVKAQWHETGTGRMPRRGLLAGDFVAGTLGAADQADVLTEVNDYLSSLL